MNSNVNKLSAVILAGGSGSRLWPLSRQQLPKQFLCLEGNQTLLEATIARLSPLVERSDVTIVTGEAHATGEAFEALDGLHTILEPVGRNTAPAIALAAAWQMDFGGGDSLMVVLPADHLIRDVEAFQHSLTVACAAAAAGDLVTFGIAPTRADTGFGYIQAAGDG
ncbi:MAG: sugar phosphate nucleotidyltransferase, partial [Mariprofundus sp.]